MATCVLAIGASCSWSAALASSDIRTVAFSPGIKAQPKALLLVQQLDASGAANVALTYPQVTSDSEVQSDVNEISRRTGWLVTNPQTTTNAGGTADRPSMTSVDFSVANALTATPGALPIEPLVTALKRFPSISIVFAMRSEFPFRGLRDFGNNYVSIQFRPTGPTYTYDVQIKDSSFESLGLPTIVEPRKNRPRPLPNGRSSGLIAPLMLSLGVGAAVWLVFRIAKSNRSS